MTAVVFVEVLCDFGVESEKAAEAVLRSKFGERGDQVVVDRKDFGGGSVRLRGSIPL